MIDNFFDLISKHLPKHEIHIIFDVGSRDALQSVEFAKKFPEAKVYAFECNPETIEQCRVNSSGYEQIVVVEKAVNEFEGSCAFFPIDTKKSVTHVSHGNPGASSLFKVTGDYPHEDLVQQEVEVECVRLDSFCSREGIPIVDLLWLDLQGAELLALKSLGVLLKDTAMIHTEVEFQPIYQNQCLFQDVDQFLTAQGFIRVTSIQPRQWADDIVYVNGKLVGKLDILKIRTKRFFLQLIASFRAYLIWPIRSLVKR
jgi:FkbM family methyltransferase